MTALSKIRQIINPPYSRKDLLAILGILVILVAIPFTIVLSLQRPSTMPKAADDIWIDASEIAPSGVYANVGGSTSVSFDAIIYHQDVFCSPGQTTSSTGYFMDPGNGITLPGLTKQTTGTYAGWYKVPLSYTCQNIGGQNLLYSGKKTQAVQTSSSTPAWTFAIYGEFPYSSGQTDSISLYVYVGGKPDLAITSFSLSNNNPLPGATVTANITAKNIGSVPLVPSTLPALPRAFSVRVYKNPSVTPPTYSADATVQASQITFQPGTQQTFGINFTAPTAVGSYTAWAWAGSSRYDPVEISTNNNYAQVAYTVGAVVIPCTNECSSAGAKQCSGTGSYQTCGLVGSCLKWSTTPCPAGQTCSGGGCSASNRPIGVTHSSGGTGSGKLENLTLGISVPYLVGSLKTKVEIGGFQKEIEVSNSNKQYQLDVKEANLALNKAQTITLKSAKTLVRKISFTPTAIQTTVSLGDLILGDINQDNSIDSTDQISLLRYITSQTPAGDLNDDKVINSFDWAILLTSFGKKGD